MPLTRATLERRTGQSAAIAPVRIVHLGLGAFHRAHQAWYTAHATDAAEWGIAAFTGRSSGVADRLAPQDGLYCLVVRGAEGDEVEVVRSLSAVHNGADLARLREYMCDSAVAIVTLTITEAGYRLGPSGTLDDADPAVTADVEQLSAIGDDLSIPTPTTALGRLLLGLEARRRSCGAPLAIVSCDNLPSNGTRTRAALVTLADRISPLLAAWIRTQVSFVSTSVDRITPHIDAEVPAVLAVGWVDAASVVTEPFSDWVLAGDFPGGRPQWESAGARFVDDIEPWENRKLWLLNGAHTILAAAGMTRGHETVAEAIADPYCRALVDGFWVEAAGCLPAELETEVYRRDVCARFANPRIVHRLSQIAGESATKVRFRLAAVAELSIEAGRDAGGTAAGIAAWIGALQAGLRMVDTSASALDECVASADPVHALLTLLSPDLAETPAFVDLVRRGVPSHPQPSALLAASAAPRTPAH